MTRYFDGRCESSDGRLALNEFHTVQPVMRSEAFHGRRTSSSGASNLHEEDIDRLEGVEVELNDSASHPSLAGRGTTVAIRSCVLRRRPAQNGTVIFVIGT